MVENPNLMTEEQVPSNWHPTEASIAMPGKAPLAAPAAPVPHDMPQFFSGSLAPALQLTPDFVASETASPRVPKTALMPFGPSASPFNNSAVTSVTNNNTTVINGGGGGTDTDFYQFVQNNGSSLIQRTNLNFQGGMGVADDAGNNATRINIWFQTIQQAGSSKTQRNKLNFLAPITATDNSGNDSTDVAVPVMVGDSGSGGVKGLVPAPASGDAAADKFLKADGTWQVVTSGPATSVLVDAAAVSIDRLSFTNGTQVTSTAWVYQINGVAATG